MTLNKPAVRKLHEEIQAVLDKLDLGFKLELGGGTYSGSNGTFKLSYSVIGADGTAKTKEATTFELYATIYKLEKTDLYRSFTDDSGERWKIIGAMPRCKSPILCERESNGQQYKLALLKVQNCLKRESVAK